MLRVTLKLLLALVLLHALGGAAGLNCIPGVAAPGMPLSSILYNQPVSPDFGLTWNVVNTMGMLQNAFDNGPFSKSAKLGTRPYKGALHSSLGPFLTAPKKAPKDKRYAISAKKDGAFGFTVADRPMTGRFDARLTVAVDKTDGLVHNSSFAALEMQRPPGGTPLVFTDIIAAYLEDENGDFRGFNCSAFTTGGALIGTPVLLEGTAEVDLRIEQTETELNTYVRPTPATSPALETGGWTLVSSQAVAPPKDPFVLGFGANNLNKKGTFYYDFFTITGDGLGSETEGPIMTQAGQAVMALDEAREELGAALPDFGAVSEQLADAVELAAAARADLAAAQAGDELLPSTQAKLADKALKRLVKVTGKLQGQIDKGKTSKPDKLIKLASAAVDDGFVVLANLAGVKTPRARKLSFVAPPPPAEPGAPCSNPPPSGGEFATATTGGQAWVATSLSARPLEGGGFVATFEDCVGAGSYLLLEFNFPGEPAVGEYNLAPFSSVTGFAKNSEDEGAFGLLFSGSLEITDYEAGQQLLEGSFTTNDLFGEGDAIADGAFRVEAFDG